MTPAIQAQIAAAKATSVAQERPTHPTKGKTPPTAREADSAPREKHVQLPPPPPDSGPWHVGSWVIRRATAYAPDCRVVAMGPAEDFPHFLAYLQAYQP